MKMIQVEEKLLDILLLKAADSGEPDFDPNEDLGEGSATEDELDYRNTLLSGLAATYTTVSTIARDKSRSTTKVQRINSIIDGFVAKSQKTADTKLQSTFDSAVEKANKTVKEINPQYKGITLPPSMLSPILQQQTSNIQDIGNYMRGRLAQGLYINDINDLYDMSDEQMERMYDFIDRTYNEAQTRVDKMGMYGWLAANKLGLTETYLLSMGILGIILVADWVSMGDTKVCDNCLELEANSPYPISEWPISDHDESCRCIQENVRIGTDEYGG